MKKWWFLENAFPQLEFFFLSYSFLFEQNSSDGMFFRPFGVDADYQLKDLCVLLGTKSVRVI